MMVLIGRILYFILYVAINLYLVHSDHTRVLLQISKQEDIDGCSVVQIKDRRVTRIVPIQSSETRAHPLCNFCKHGSKSTLECLRSQSSVNETCLDAIDYCVSLNASGLPSERTLQPMQHVNLRDGYYWAYGKNTMEVTTKETKDDFDERSSGTTVENTIKVTTMKTQEDFDEKSSAFSESLVTWTGYLTTVESKGNYFVKINYVMVIGFIFGVLVMLGIIVLIVILVKRRSTKSEIPEITLNNMSNNSGRPQISAYYSAVKDMIQTDENTQEGSDSGIKFTPSLPMQMSNYENMHAINMENNVYNNTYFTCMNPFPKQDVGDYYNVAIGYQNNMKR